jgi:hypothetical protein
VNAMRNYYHRAASPSRHRVWSTPMSTVELTHLVSQFRAGRATREQRQWLIWEDGMNESAFIQKNNVEIVEPVFEVMA